MSAGPLLDRIKFPKDLRCLRKEQLIELSAELRQELIATVAQTGGHLGAGLGVVELTIALHYVFNTPYDRLIWDVGHQAYPHKILTGRREFIASLRQKNGLSGFTKRCESPFDCFGAGHSSTSISAGVGMVVANMLAGNEDRNVIAVIGDGAMSAGMAYEGLNNAADHASRLIVILNDNDMSIAPPTGAMSSYLAKIVSSPDFRALRDKAKDFSKIMPNFLQDKLRLSEEYARGLFTGGSLFSELGFYYIGPIDGHDFDHLLPVFENIKARPKGPLLIHVITQKGKGYRPAELAYDKYHGVERFDIATGEPCAKIAQPSYTKIFAKSLIEEAKRDEKIIAITAAMPSGTGLDLFAQYYKNRMFDVGIAEQHAVTFAAGLAAEGYKPFVAIYSTFLQRAYDQIVHDVSIQNLPVRFAIDRAGVVGPDGPTHTGSFDISFLINLPNFVIMAPKDGEELRDMVHSAAHYDKGPIAIRYPRRLAEREPDFKTPQIIKIGKAAWLKKGSKLALIALGSMVEPALAAAAILAKENTHISVINARFAKPLDEEMLQIAAQQHEIILSLEEGARSGFGSYVLEYLVRAKLYGKEAFCKYFEAVTFPDQYLNQARVEEVLAEIGLDSASLVQKIRALLAEHF